MRRFLSEVLWQIDNHDGLERASLYTNPATSMHDRGTACLRVHSWAQNKEKLDDCQIALNGRK